MSFGPRADKFNISNNHGHRQKWDFCVCLKSKTPCICRFSPSSFSPRLFLNIREFGAKKYFTDHHIRNVINGFRGSVLVCKMHDCFKLYSISIILLLKNNLFNICSGISKIWMILWMVYTWYEKLWKYKTNRWK